jgi:hypothetical protein
MGITPCIGYVKLMRDAFNGRVVIYSLNHDTTIPLAYPFLNFPFLALTGGITV